MPFWNTDQRTPLVYQKVKDAAKIGVVEFRQALNENPVARRGFWNFIFDKDDFKQWKAPCKKALFTDAWYDGFMTITHHPQAMVAVFAATSLSMFALSIIVGTSASLFSCFMMSCLIFGASYVMDYLSEDEPDYPFTSVGLEQ